MSWDDFRLHAARLFWERNHEEVPVQFAIGIHIPATIASRNRFGVTDTSLTARAIPLLILDGVDDPFSPWSFLPSHEDDHAGSDHTAENHRD